MKRKSVYFGLISLVILTLVLSTQPLHAKTRGYWETYTHTKTIKWGEGLYHIHKHEGALSGYAYVQSSTGSYSFEYDWDEPNLHVWISNTDNEDITVTFKCKFYVN